MFDGVESFRWWKIFATFERCFSVFKRQRESKDLSMYDYCCDLLSTSLTLSYLTMFSRHRLEV